MQINLSRGSFDVDLPLLAPDPRTPVVSTDVGAPEIEFYKTGRLNPTFIDQKSRILTDNINGTLFFSDSDTDYNTAIELADMIKSNGNGNSIDATIPLPEYDSNVLRVPAAGQNQALQLVYNPGRKGAVQTSLGLTRVSRINGGVEQEASTPTNLEDNGPIQISGPSATVSIETDVQVTRTVGRPNSEIKPTSAETLPFYVEHQKSAFDAFELRFKFLENVDTIVPNLRDLFDTRLGTNSLTLDFNGIYNLGSFNVIPEGSQALRFVRQSSEQGTSTIPTVNLRVVQ